MCASRHTTSTNGREWHAPIVTKRYFYSLTSFSRKKRVSGEKCKNFLFSEAIMYGDRTIRRKFLLPEGNDPPLKKTSTRKRAFIYILRVPQNLFQAEQPTDAALSLKKWTLKSSSWPPWTRAGSLSYNFPHGTVEWTCLCDSTKPGRLPRSLEVGKGLTVISVMKSMEQGK